MLRRILRRRVLKPYLARCPRGAGCRAQADDGDRQREFSLVPLKELANNALRRALETIFRVLDDIKGAKSPLHLPT